MWVWPTVPVSTVSTSQGTSLVLLGQGDMMSLKGSSYGHKRVMIKTRIVNSHSSSRSEAVVSSTWNFKSPSLALPSLELKSCFVTFSSAEFCSASVCQALSSYQVLPVPSVTLACSHTALPRRHDCLCSGDKETEGGRWRNSFKVVELGFQPMCCEERISTRLGPVPKKPTMQLCRYTLTMES